MNDEFVIIQWPEVQELMDKEGFYDNSHLVVWPPLYEEFGAQSYFVRKQWLDSIN